LQPLIYTQSTVTNSQLPAIQHLQNCTISEPQKEWVWIASCIANKLQFLPFVYCYIETVINKAWRRFAPYKSQKCTYCSQT